MLSLWRDRAVTAILAFRMERVRLVPPGETRARGERARLYVRWMPHLGAEAVALYELLRILPDIGQDSVEVEELAELLRSDPESVERSFGARHPPASRPPSGSWPRPASSSSGTAGWRSPSTRRWAG